MPFARPGSAREVVDDARCESRLIEVEELAMGPGVEGIAAREVPEAGNVEVDRP
jgi:hypothetical protein